MTTTTTYRYNLDRTSKKHKCPQCGHKTFNRVVDSENGQYLPDHVGRCDREHRCSYEYKWSEYLKEAGETARPFIEVKAEEVKPIEFIPLAYLQRTVKNYSQNNLFLFLKNLFSEEVAINLCRHYLIGTSKHWKGATIYPQIDEEGRLRQLKIILYNPTTGKRVKEGETVERYSRKTGTYITEVSERSCSMVYGKFLSEETKGMNLEQTWFGHHLLTEFPDREVCIVESEKTALIASVFMPSYVWLATGGARGGCRWREYFVYKALKNRSVTFFPDYGWADKKKGITCYAEWCQRIEAIKDVLPVQRLRVSDVLETALAGQERQDQDLADILLKSDEATRKGLAYQDLSTIWEYDPL